MARAANASGSALDADLVIRPQRPEDDARSVDIGNRLNPEFPPSTVEEYRKFLQTVPPGVKQLRLVAEWDGTIVGRGFVGQMYWTQNPDSYEGSIGVLPEHAHRGIGSALFNRLLKTAREFSSGRVYGEVREDRAVAQQFAERRGFRPTGHVMRLSRLAVQNANFEGYDGLEDRLGAEGIRVESLAALGPDDEGVLRSVYEVDLSTAQDEPGSEQFSMAFEQWREFILKRPGMSADAIWVALNQEQPIGYAMLRRQGGNNAWHQGTGVERPYRGKGVARLLKLHAIRWALRNGVDFLYTGNDVDNPRMYAINMRLGYQPLPATIEVVRDLRS